MKEDGPGFPKSDCYDIFNSDYLAPTLVLLEFGHVGEGEDRELIEH